MAHQPAPPGKEGNPGELRVPPVAPPGPPGAPGSVVTRVSVAPGLVALVQGATPVRAVRRAQAVRRAPAPEVGGRAAPGAAQAKAAAQAKVATVALAAPQARPEAAVAQAGEYPELPDKAGQPAGRRVIPELPDRLAPGKGGLAGARGAARSR